MWESLFPGTLLVHCGARRKQPSSYLMRHIYTLKVRRTSAVYQLVQVARVYRSYGEEPRTKAGVRVRWAAHHQQRVDRRFTTDRDSTLIVQAIENACVC